MEKGPWLNCSRSRTMEAFLNAMQGFLPSSRVIFILLDFCFVFCPCFILLPVGQSLGLPAFLLAAGGSHTLTLISLRPHSVFFFCLQYKPHQPPVPYTSLSGGRRCSLPCLAEESRATHFQKAKDEREVETLSWHSGKLPSCQKLPL